MFTGSVCSQVREWFKANAEAFAQRVVLSGCCGNFTIETVLSQAKSPPAKIISNDISLYSSALGAYYTEAQPLSLSIRAEGYRWLETYMRTTQDTAAAMVVLLELAPYANCRTAYHRRMCEQITSRFEYYHTKAKERVEKRKEVLRIAEYDACDVVRFA